MAITITYDEEEHRRILKSLQNFGKNLNKEVNIALTITTRKGKAKIAKEVGAELNLPQKHIKKAIYTKRYNDWTRVIFFNQWRPVFLKQFKARQNAKGASARIMKSEGSTLFPGAFTGNRGKGKNAPNPKLKGHFFRRLSKKSKPIEIIKTDDTPLNVFKRVGMTYRMSQYLHQQLQLELIDRIRFNRLKQSGAI